MAIPSGSGTEVLKVYYQPNITNSATTIITGVANHIYTIISIIVCEEAGNAENFYLFRTDSGDSNMCRILYSQAIGANETFIWNDRFVLSGSDKLKIQTVNAANLHMTISYIDQDWT